MALFSNSVVPEEDKKIGTFHTAIILHIVRCVKYRLFDVPGHDI
jgi:hypothetical protein